MFSNDDRGFLCHVTCYFYSKLSNDDINPFLTHLISGKISLVLSIDRNGISRMNLLNSLINSPNVLKKFIYLLNLQYSIKIFVIFLN